MPSPLIPPLDSAQQAAQRAAVAAHRKAHDKARTERERLLIESDRASDLARRLLGAVNQPEDFGPDGPAQQQRQGRIEAAEGLSGGSAARHGIRTYYRRITHECVLDGLYRRAGALLDHDRWQAGMKFRRQWLASRASARGSARYGERFGGGGGPLEESERSTQARGQVNAVLAVLTPAQTRAVVAVCGEDELLGLRGKSLANGLRKLIVFYGIGDAKKVV